MNPAPLASAGPEVPVSVARHPGDAETVAVRPADLLAQLSAAVHQRLHPVPVGDVPTATPRGDGPQDGVLAWLPGLGDPAVGWVSVADLLVDADLLGPLIEAGARRFRSHDRALVVAQVARETISALTTVAVDLWVRQRRLLDLSAANVVLGADGRASVVGVRRPAFAALLDDPLVGQPEVEVIEEPEMFDRLLDLSIGPPVPAGTAPQGRPASVAAVATIIAAVRQVVRCGDRHLWGTAALAAASAASRLDHLPRLRAGEDRAALLAARPDLARTVELVTVPGDGRCDGRCDGSHGSDDSSDGPARSDGSDRSDDSSHGSNGSDDSSEASDGDITFPLRRTCCLLLKLPDGLQCGTCSLGDRSYQIDRLTNWHHAERRRLR